MKLVNKDLTREKIEMFITNNQIYIKIWAKNSHGKWETSEYFQSYDWEIEDSLIESTIRYITRLWKLQNPLVIISK